MVEGGLHPALQEEVTPTILTNLTGEKNLPNTKSDSEFDPEYMTSFSSWEVGYNL